MTLLLRNKYEKDREPKECTFGQWIRPVIPRRSIMWYDSDHSRLLSSVQDENSYRRDVTVETIEYDDSVHDPTWTPGQPIQKTSDEKSGRDTRQPRYYLRSHDRQDCETSNFRGSPQAGPTPQVQLNPIQDVSVLDKGLNQDAGPDRNLPYPYLLRPLPGRRIS